MPDDDRTQSDKFKDLAREVEADPDPRAWDVRLRKLAAKFARSPRRAGSIASIRARRERARIGAVPADEMATMTGSRSTMAGMMNEERAASSTTFTGTLAAFAA